MPVYRLINPSDDYTFLAPDIVTAGVAVCLISTSFGAADTASDESSPVFAGWSEWLDSYGVNDEWVEAHSAEIVAALRSFLIGSAADRIEVDAALAKMPADQHAAFLADRQRSSMNNIGDYARTLGDRLEAKHQKASDGKKEQAASVPV